MKKILFLTIVLLTVLVLISKIDQSKLAELSNYLSFSVCDNPIHYRIDTVDPKFNLSEDEFLSDVDSSAQIWSKIYGKPLFIYDPKGDLSVNLIYDERQSLTNQINQLENTVQSDQQSIKPQISEFQKESAEFKQKVEALNKEIDSWNEKGGAPKDVYEQLIQKQRDLQNEASKLNSMAKQLNASAEVVNSQVDQLNQTISNFNSALTLRPEEGIFKGPENRIEIYFNISKPELVHTLAHELGHALGLEHNSNPISIMFSRTNQKITPSNDDIEALDNLCKRHSYFEVIQTVISRFIQRLKTTH